MNFLGIFGIAILIAFFFYMNDIINRMYMDIKFIRKHVMELKPVQVLPTKPIVTAES